MFKKRTTLAKLRSSDDAEAKGFTLIELLIVIVIIGILAGVLMAVINPAKQQNRARDANVIATINKVVLATQGYVSAYGSAPDEVQMLGGLNFASDSGGGTPVCGTTGGFDCTFAVTGNNLPSTCTGASNGWNGNGATQCYYRYYRNNSASPWAVERFRIYAKSFGLTGRIFAYDTSLGQMYNCDATANLDGTADLSASASCSL